MRIFHDLQEWQQFRRNLNLSIENPRQNENDYNAEQPLQSNLYQNTCPSPNIDPKESQAPHHLFSENDKVKQKIADQAITQFDGTCTQDKLLGFVPTMGALHEGHSSLIRKAKLQNLKVVVSIYVNPTQFNNPQDLETYPQTWEADVARLRGLNVDYLLAPTYTQLYPDDFRFQITETELSKKWCGAHRQGHFTGVLSVVMKLLNLVQPQRAYFGEKDYQQFLLVRDMAAAYFIPTEIIGCPTVRENDGLAMSSRNLRLSPAARLKAPRLAEILRQSSSSAEACLRLKNQGFLVDYVEDFEKRRLAAVVLEDVRLIDNVQI
jgi:pantoate--beta-alanine ligase